MLKFILLCILFFFSGRSVNALNIVRIEDSNLFALNSGQKIRLANVRTPSLSDSNPAMAALAVRIKRFAEKQLIRQKVEIEFTTSYDDSGYVLAHVYQIYPLEKRNINQVFLAKGFGRFIDNVQSTHQEAYRQAEKSARKKRLGIWNPNYPAPAAAEGGLQLALFFGGFKEKQDASDHEESYYQEVMIERAPLEKVSGLSARIGLIRHVENRGCCECINFEGNTPGTYRHVSIMMYGDIRVHVINEYMGFSLGLTAAYNEPNYCSEFPMKYFILPNGGLKIGLMKKVYVTADLFREFLLPFSLGLQYIFERKGTNVWLGIASYNKENYHYALKADYLLNKRWIIKVHGLLSYPDMAPAIRIGLGRIFSEK